MMCNYIPLCYHAGIQFQTTERMFFMTFPRRTGA